MSFSEGGGDPSTQPFHPFLTAGLRLRSLSTGLTSSKSSGVCGRFEDVLDVLEEIEGPGVDEGVYGKSGDIIGGGVTDVDRWFVAIWIDGRIEPEAQNEPSSWISPPTPSNNGQNITIVEVTNLKTDQRKIVFLGREPEIIGRIVSLLISTPNYGSWTRMSDFELLNEQNISIQNLHNFIHENSSKLQLLKVNLIQMQRVSKVKN